MSEPHNPSGAARGQPSAALQDAVEAADTVDDLATTPSLPFRRPAWLTLLLVVAIIALASLVFIAIARFVGLTDDGAIAQYLAGLASSPWALPATVALFVLASFAGTPQFLLIAITVAAFGPLQGIAFAYLSTLTSASTNFFAARVFGERINHRRDGGRFDRVLQRISDNGFWAALIVRIVPSGPFVVVNAALGLARTPYAHFIAGTALGIIPKMAVIALLGETVDRAWAGDGWSFATLASAACLWLALTWLARRWVQSKPNA